MEIIEMEKNATRFLDLALRTFALVMSVGSVALLIVEAISMENAVVMLGIAVTALVLERLTEK